MSEILESPRTFFQLSTRVKTCEFAFHGRKPLKKPRKNMSYQKIFKSRILSLSAVVKPFQNSTKRIRNSILESVLLQFVIKGSILTKMNNFLQKLKTRTLGAKTFLCRALEGLFEGLR